MANPNQDQNQTPGQPGQTQPGQGQGRPGEQQGGQTPGQQGDQNRPDQDRSAEPR